MRIEAIYRPCEDPTNALCVPYPSDISNHPDPLKIDHEFGLVAEGLLADTDYYIAGCIATDQGARCTTGDSDLDAFLNNLPGSDVLFKDPSHEFRALENPKKTDNQGVLKVVVRSFTPGVTAHFFRAYRIIDQAAEVFPSVTVVEGDGANQSGIKLGTTSRFVSPTPIPPTPTRPPEASEGEAEVNWNWNDNFNWNDPKGRFFDIRSLEPIPEGEVTLLDKEKKLFNFINLINPQPVKINGEFNFWVPNGIYHLYPNKLPKGYRWPVRMGDVDKNYQKAYYCDPEVKDINNQPVSLYFDQFRIYEYDKLVHCDIPLDPGTNQPYSYDVKTVTYSSFRNADNTRVTYIAGVTHPLTIVYLKETENNKTITTISADKLGRWTFTSEIKNNLLNSNGLPVKLNVFYKKVDLTNKKVYEPVKADVQFDPILSYIEGYAYDENNQIVPNARVGYKQQGTDKIVYVTKTDSQGYFKIPTVYLPTFSYKLVFLASNKQKPVIQSINEFISKNSDYLKKNKINLLKNDPSRILPEKVISNEKSTFDKFGQKNNDKELGQTLVNQRKNVSIFQLVIIFVIIFILIAVLSLFLYLNIKKKKEIEI